MLAVVNLCVVSGCGKRRRANGLCQRHWVNMKRHGTLEAPPRERPFDERFWEKVDRSGGPDACWPWTSNRLPEAQGNYGTFYGGKGKVLRAHRVAYVLAGGTLRPREVVRHSCDNPPCCNPRHLLRGTQADNVQDMMERDRHTPVSLLGESGPSAKLAEAQVIEILRSVAAGAVKRRLAERYGVSESLIGKIAQGKLWPHLATDVPRTPARPVRSRRRPAA